MTSLRFPPDFTLQFLLHRDLRSSSCEYSGVEFSFLAILRLLARALGRVESLRYIASSYLSPLDICDPARCAYTRQALLLRAKSSRGLLRHTSSQRSTLAPYQSVRVPLLYLALILATSSEVIVGPLGLV